MPFSFAAVILAAGRSVRMGQPKLLLPWGETSIIGHLLEQWREMKAQQIAVVCAAGDAPIQTELNRLGCAAGDRIMNPAPDRGMFSSIQCAAPWKGWKAGLTHWAIILGDQPQLSREALQTIIGFSVANPSRICLLRQGGHRRHPVLIPRQEFAELANSGATDLKFYLDSRPIAAALCDLNDAALELDIDTPEDYERIAPVPGAIGAPFKT